MAPRPPLSDPGSTSSTPAVAACCGWGGARTVKTALRFFRWSGRPRTQALRFVSSDMRKPSLKVIAKKAPGALHILDRFHLTTHLSKAIDQVRAEEARAPGAHEEGGGHADRASAPAAQLAGGRISGGAVE